MSYTKKTWETGEVIQATDMNHIENGVKDANDTVSNLSTDVQSIQLAMANMPTYGVIYITTQDVPEAEGIQLGGLYYVMYDPISEEYTMIGDGDNSQLDYIYIYGNVTSLCYKGYTLPPISSNLFVGLIRDEYSTSGTINTSGEIGSSISINTSGGTTVNGYLIRGTGEITFTYGSVQNSV